MCYLESQTEGSYFQGAGIRLRCFTLGAKSCTSLHLPLGGATSGADPTVRPGEVGGAGTSLTPIGQLATPRDELAPGAVCGAIPGPDGDGRQLDIDPNLVIFAKTYVRDKYTYRRVQPWPINRNPSRSSTHI